MKILSVVGARPQFVKLAAIARGIDHLREAGETIDHVIVHTGQHYDASMSDVFFDDLRIPAPDVNLAIGSANHGAQTGRMLESIEQVLIEHRPDWALVYGDTNSTLAGAIAAAKLGIPIAHLEAGLRSFNRAMPEEINRVLTDHAADLLLAPTQAAADHLSREGLLLKTKVTGDVMADVCLSIADAIRKDGLVPTLPQGIDPNSPYFVATIHRAENTDDSKRLQAIIENLQSLQTPVVLFAHPRLVKRAADLNMELERNNVHLASPAPYPHLIAAVIHSTGVVTDSGGLQKEAFLLDVLCTTIRTETEWIETLENGWNVLVEDPKDLKSVVSRNRPSIPRGTPYGTGNAAELAIRTMIESRPGLATEGHHTKQKEPTPTASDPGAVKAGSSEAYPGSA